MEGQADALTLDQWGIPAVALAGTFAGDGLLASLFEKAVYLGLDTDQAGKTGGKKTAQALGPMTRIISWSADGQYNELPGEDNNHQDKTENAAEDGGLSKEKGAREGGYVTIRKAGEGCERLSAGHGKRGSCPCRPG